MPERRWTSWVASLLIHGLIVGLVLLAPGGSDMPEIDPTKVINVDMVGDPTKPAGPDIDGMKMAGDTKAPTAAPARTPEPSGSPEETPEPPQQAKATPIATPEPPAPEPEPTPEPPKPEPTPEPEPEPAAAPEPPKPTPDPKATPIADKKAEEKPKETPKPEPEKVAKKPEKKDPPKPPKKVEKQPKPPKVKPPKAQTAKKDPPKPRAPKVDPQQKALADALKAAKAEAKKQQQADSDALKNALAEVEGARSGSGFQKDGTGGAGGPGRGGGGGGNPLQAYGDYVSRIVKQYWVLPPTVTSRMDVQSSVVVSIDREGRITGFYVENGSGRRDYDASTIKALTQTQLQAQLTAPPTRQDVRIRIFFNAMEQNS